MNTTVSNDAAKAVAETEPQSPTHTEDPRLADPMETVSEQPARGWAPPSGGLLKSIAFGLVAVMGALIVLYSWHLPPFTTMVESTDDAQVRGQTTIIAPQVNGYVTRVLVKDFQSVRAGQPLAQIDDRIYRQRVQQAEANLANAQAQLANSTQARASRVAGLGSSEAGAAGAEAQLARARAEYQRVAELSRQGWVTRANLDTALAALRQAQAGVQQAQAGTTVATQEIRTVEVGRGGLEALVENAKAALRLAQIDLENTAIRAPQDGQVGEIGVRLGQYVTAGSQLMFLVPRITWVVANFREAQTARMASGQPVVIRVDALRGAKLTGHLERLAPAAGSEFSVIRPDNATGNFVKVAQRIAVRVVIDPGQPLSQRLRPGMSVEARVDTASSAPTPRTS
jgi:multidrug resistance efflux pump